MACQPPLGRRGLLSRRSYLILFRRILEPLTFYGVRPYNILSGLQIIYLLQQQSFLDVASLGLVCVFFVWESTLSNIQVVFTLLLPEVKGRDPDAVFAAEIEEKRIATGTSRK